jgi:uncharacterized protein
MKKQIELRVWHSPTAKCSRAKAADAPIKGVASVFYNSADPSTEYWLWSDMVERIMPSAFDRALKEKHDVRGLFNHDPTMILGRTAAGTLALSIVSEGLAYEIPYDEKDVDHQRVASKLDRGDVTGSSFAFVATRTTWVEEKKESGEYLYIRQVEDLDLYDVGPVTYPAYTGTTAGRSVANHRLSVHGFRRGSEIDYAAEYRALCAERDAYLGDAVAVRMAALRAAA